MASTSLSVLAEFYGLPEKLMRKTIENESRWIVDAHNKRDPNGGSKGIAQFQDGTFNEYSSKLGIDEPDIWNPIHQIEVMSYMWSLSDRLRDRWTGYKKISPHLK